MTGDPFIHVAVGVIADGIGRVLITRRPDHTHQGGLWEFPGGKVEAGESTLAALRRELHEELGIIVLAARPLIRVRHRYAERAVLLDVWRVENYQGEPHGIEGQPCDWAHPMALRERAFPAADAPIITALRLPAEYLITGEPAADPPLFLARLEQALRRGIRLVQLRAKTLPEDRLIELYGVARSLCADYDATLLANCSPELARRLDAEGVHLGAAHLMTLNERPLGTDRWVAASCHNPDEIRQAVRVGVDFIVVSPVRATGSHPAALPLGWEGFAALAEIATMPVYALGGMTPAELDHAWAHGAQGIAAIRAWWEPVPLTAVR